jgi:hypothetical protein
MSVGTKLAVDGQLRSAETGRDLILEFKYSPADPSTLLRRRWPHVVVLLSVLLATAVVPRFLLTFLLLTSAVLLSLMGFVFLIQLPVRFFATRLRELRRSSDTTQDRQRATFG